MDQLTDLVFLIVGLLFGAVAAWFVAKYRHAGEHVKVEEALKASDDRIRLAQNQLQEREAVLESERSRNEDLNRKVSIRETELTHLREKLEEQKVQVEDLQAKFTKEFENLANKIFEEKSQKFVQQNKVKLEDVLNPLKEKIRDFEKKVEDTNKESIERHASLKQQIISLSELNEKMSIEAKNLTKALKGDTKAQGNWGEMILDSLLERSGLTKGREYVVQESMPDADGRRLQPDVVINLPENKKIIIDSKVSLVAYDRFASEEDAVERERHLKEHVQSLKNHVKVLGEKNYHELYGINSPDFVLLFVPIEPAFNLAVKSNPELYNQAWNKNIVMVSTSTLLATLMIISSLWKLEYQNRNVMQIASESGKLYDKFVGFVSDLEDIGKRMDMSKKSYDQAMKKLSTGTGSLVGRAEKIKKLGAKASKSLPDNLVSSSREEQELGPE